MRDIEPLVEPPYLSLAKVLRYEPIAEELGVSEVARASGGFIEQYERAEGRKVELTPWWRRHRAGFVARHMAQLEDNREALFTKKGLPTRRHLALIMWAYSPVPKQI